MSNLKPSMSSINMSRTRLFYHALEHPLKVYNSILCGRICAVLSELMLDSLVRNIIKYVPPMGKDNKRTTRHSKILLFLLQDNIKYLKSKVSASVCVTRPYLCIIRGR